MPSQAPLTSDELAALVVDALVEAGLIDKSQFGVADQIAAEEIEARKSVGDYS